jgi:hypothetical protein
MQDIVTWDAGAGQGLYGARSSGLTVNQLFVPGLNQDDVPAAGGAGTSYSTYWTGPWITFQQPYRRHRLREVHFDGKGRMAFSIARNFQKVPEAVFNTLFGTEAGTFGTNDGSL